MNEPTCRRCSGVVGDDYLFTEVSREFLCATCKVLPEEVEREAREVAEKKVQDEADEKVDIFLAEHLDGYHVVGKANCSNYDGCPSVHGDDWSDLPRLPVFVNPSDWDDKEHYYREEIHRPQAAIDNAERFKEHPEWCDTPERRAEMEKAMVSHDHYVGGWHVHALEPVYNYTGSGHQMQRILEEMKKRGWQVNIRNESDPQMWVCSLSNGYEANSGVDKDIVRAVAYAAARALGMS